MQTDFSPIEFSIIVAARIEDDALGTHIAREIGVDRRDAFPTAISRLAGKFEICVAKSRSEERSKPR